MTTFTLFDTNNEASTSFRSYNKLIEGVVDALSGWVAMEKWDEVKEKLKQLAPKKELIAVGAIYIDVEFIGEDDATEGDVKLTVGKQHSIDKDRPQLWLEIAH